MKVQINPSIDTNIKKLLDMEAKSRNVRMGDIVSAALTEHFDPNASKEREAILLKTLERLNRKVQTIELNLEILSEALSLFLKTYFSRLTDIPQEQKAAVKSKGEEMFERFVQKLESSCAAGNSLFSALPRKDFINAELAETMQDLINE